MKQILAITIGLISITLLIGCQLQENQSEQNEEEVTTVGMLQHTVYFYLNEEVTDEERADFEEGLKELLSIEEVYFFQIGVPGDTEQREVTDHSFAYSISAWFQTMEDYEVYADHPEFVEEYSDLWADVKVYDSDIIAEK